MKHIVQLSDLRRYRTGQFVVRTSLGLLLCAAQAFAVTTLTVGELELQDVQNASVPVEFHSDASVSALQMDALFDSAAYTGSTATPGTLPATFRVDSFLVEPSRLRVVVGAANNGALVDGTIFQVPLTAVNAFASGFPVVLTNFALSNESGVAVQGFLAPRVRLLGLTADAKISGKNGITLSVEVNATGGNVARVEYYVGGTKVGESTSAPFSFTWSPIGSGPFVIQAIAYDSNGLMTGSRSIPVVITNVGTEAIKGVYAGLARTSPFIPAGSGSIQFLTTATSAFSVKLFLDGKRYGQKGNFAADGTAALRFDRGKKLAALTLTLQQYTTNLIDQIAGQLTDGTLNGSVIENSTFIADVVADRTLWRVGTREPAQKGRYTIVLPAASDAGTSGASLGDGVGTAKVKSSGTVTSNFVLADGTKASQGTFLTKDGRWHLFAVPIGTKGVMLGDLDFADNAGVSDFAGQIDWFRPAQKAAPFKEGFQTSIDAVGSKYDVPEKFERVLSLANVAGNARFTAEDGGLAAPFERLLTINSTNVVSLLGSDAARLGLKIDAKMGMITGSFIHPTTGKTAPVIAVAFQKQDLAHGFFGGGAQGGGVTVDPNPNFPPPINSLPQGAKALPTVNFVGPKEGARVNAPAAVVFRGTAKGKKPIITVRYQLVYAGVPGALQLATGTASWTASIQPAAMAGGFYKIFVKATDNSGNESDVVARTVFYVVPTPLTVTIVGSGEVTKGFNGTTSRDVGATYTITAKSQAGHRFKGWTGSITSSAPTITFTMVEGFDLQANFQ